MLLRHRISWSISFGLLDSFQVDFSSAENEVKRRRPIIDSVAQDSDGNYIDQLAQDSAFNSKAQNIAAAPDGYRGRYHTGDCTRLLVLKIFINFACFSY